MGQICLPNVNNAGVILIGKFILRRHVSARSLSFEESNGLSSMTTAL